MPDKCTEHKHVVDSLNEIKTDVKEILKLHNGNGKMGLCAKMSVLWTGSIFVVVTVIGLLIKTVWAAIAGV